MFNIFSYDAVLSENRTHNLLYHERMRYILSHDLVFNAKIKIAVVNAHKIVLSLIYYQGYNDRSIEANLIFISRLKICFKTQ